MASVEGAIDGDRAIRERPQGLRQAVADFQNTRFKLAELRPKIQVAPVFVDRCVEDLVAGKLDTATASMAKYWTPTCNAR